MKVTGIDCHVIVQPDFDTDACSSAQEDLVVEVHTDEGITGIGETDVNPWVARECIRAKGTHVMAMGLTEMLIGSDPMQPEAIWARLYQSSKMTGRRGALICAMGAIDMALWDLKGKALGLPVHALLGGSTKKAVTPYASLLPTGRTVDAYVMSLVAKLQKAVELGFIAAKVEVCLQGPYSHNGLQSSDEAVLEAVRACREAVGPYFTLMVDVAYAWPTARAALRAVERLAQYDLFFIETPIDIDDLDGYAYLHDHSPVPIAAGEWQTTHFEFEDLIERGKVDVVQPDIGRVGGFTEARRVAEFAADRGRIVVPHCWKTGIGIAASAHLSAATPCSPFFEMLPSTLSESSLRRELVLNEPPLHEGRLMLSEAPGLGVELNRDALARYEVDERP